MCDEWMPAIKLPLSWEQFHQLPRNPAYKYEYFNNTAYLTPRPKHFHAVLDLEPAARELPVEAEEGTRLRPLECSHILDLQPLFAGAFSRTQPFGSLDDATRKQAAHQCLERTATGKDGPLIEPACFVAFAETRNRPVGAIMVTLLPDSDPCDWDSYYWCEPPSPDCVARRLGRPHLTWIFVSPLRVGHGLGSALLAASVNGLLRLGYTQLLSTFLFGNEASMLWHWRAGFRLLPYPGSWRRIKKESEKERPACPNP
jgi:GNAT superfamily N-acetyltransferase